MITIIEVGEETIENEIAEDRETALMIAFGRP
jgi:hypothetical protein